MIPMLLSLLCASREEIGFGSKPRAWVDEARSQGWRIDSTDAEVFTKTMQDFGPYLESVIGRAKLSRVERRIKTPYDVSDALAKVTGRRFGEYYPSFYSYCESKSRVADTSWLSRESEHFIFLYHPWSMASRDLALIESVAEQAFDDITTILAPDSSQHARIKRVIMTGDSAPYYSGGKIPVRLHASRSGVGGYEEFSGGQTGFRPVWFADTVGYALWINLGYPGTPGLFGIPHEVAHALALLYLSNEVLLADLMRGGGYVPSNKLRAAVLPDDLLRLEGWAYMVQNNYSAYVRLALWRSSREAMASASMHFGFPDCFNLLNGEVSKTALERTLSVLGLDKSLDYAERMRYFFTAADMIRYLYERYGSAKLASFLADQREPMEALLAVYSLTPYALEDEWKKDVVSK
jgi:hypothetical protein